MRLPEFLRRKIRITLHLRSGATISLRCREFEIRKAADQSLTGYTFTGGDGSVFYVRLDDISAITKT